jgi:branched-subunit amino acid ABC-type transport system permease component
MSQGAFASICGLVGFVVLVALDRSGAIEMRPISMWPRLVLIACILGGAYVHTLLDRWVVRSLREKERFAQGIRSSKGPGQPRT